MITKRKLMLLMVLVTMTFHLVHAQTGKLVNDTVYYGHTAIYINKKVQLLYGSNTNKNFIFIYNGNNWTGVFPLDANSAKSMVTITKIYMTRGKYFAMGVLDDPAAHQSKRVTINIEAAIDNKELKED